MSLLHRLGHITVMAIQTDEATPATRGLVFTMTLYDKVGEAYGLRKLQEQSGIRHGTLHSYEANPDFSGRHLTEFFERIPASRRFVFEETAETDCECFVSCVTGHKSVRKSEVIRWLKNQDVANYPEFIITPGASAWQSFSEIRDKYELFRCDSAI